MMMSDSTANRLPFAIPIVYRCTGAESHSIINSNLLNPSRSAVDSSFDKEKKNFFPGDLSACRIFFVRETGRGDVTPHVAGLGKPTAGFLPINALFFIGARMGRHIDYANSWSKSFWRGGWQSWELAPCLALFFFVQAASGCCCESFVFFHLKGKGNRGVSEAQEPVSCVGNSRCLLHWHQ